MMVALVFNSFRYSSSGSLHATLVHASGLLDHRWSILFLVRGHPSTNGLARSMYRGISLLAAEFGVPVVPTHITGLERHIPLLRIPYRDSVTVRFSEPITCKPEMNQRDVEAALEAAR
jgi:1-acyl-sn-glycerol-3-phosphate acyltransferase